jgi:hypothetical protein
VLESSSPPSACVARVVVARWVAVVKAQQAYRRWRPQTNFQCLLLTLWASLAERFPCNNRRGTISRLDLSTWRAVTSAGLKSQAGALHVSPFCQTPLFGFTTAVIYERDPRNCRHPRHLGRRCSAQPSPPQIFVSLHLKSVRIPIVHHSTTAADANRFLLFSFLLSNLRDGSTTTR